MPDFLSALPPLTLLVLLVFLFAIALVVALWSLLTLGVGPRTLAVARAPRAKKVKATTIKPLPSNRFMKQKVEEKTDEDVASELPTNHVSRSRVRILKTLEPDPELETPAFKPTTYDQLVNRQRAPKKSLPKVNSGLPTDSLNAGLSRQAREIGAPKTPLREANRPVPEVHTLKTVQQPVVQQPTPKTPSLRADTEDTSTQPSLFEARNRRVVPAPRQQTPVEPEPPLQEFRQVPRKPSVQREESEAAFRASQGSDTQSLDSQSLDTQGLDTKRLDSQVKPKTQKEKDEAFENFLRKNDDLGF
jgi:hypothetical protein